MSDTPRSDKAELDDPWMQGVKSGWVDLDFARQLELELNKTEQFLKIADEDYETFRDYVWFLEREAGEVATQKAMEAFNNRTKE